MIFNLFSFLYLFSISFSIGHNWSIYRPYRWLKGVRIGKVPFEWRVTTLCKYSNFQGIFFILNDLIFRKSLHESSRSLSFFLEQLESLYLDVCRRSSGQNTKTTQSWKVAMLWRDITGTSRHTWMSRHKWPL